MIKRSDIHMRDPFIITDKQNNCYYMYGTTSLTDDVRDVFVVYKTEDLENFHEPKVIFKGSEIGFWADRDYWAPEVHIYKGKYYLFASFKSPERRRCTQILVSDTPDGFFMPISECAPTPSDWECLDGTLYVDENGTPYMVFCHEWVQIKDGDISAIQLSEDLTHAVGEPFSMFKASDDPDVTEYTSPLGKGHYVSDGPFFFNDNDGKVKMIWSSYHCDRYITMIAESDSIHGEWKHSGSLFDIDAGHGMIFNTLDGKRMISMHSPNTWGFERPIFLEFK